MSKRNQNKPHKTHPCLYAELCKAVSPRVAKRQLRKVISQCYQSRVADYLLIGSFVWSCSPQGYDYWYNVNTKIDQVKGYQNVKA